MFCFYNWTRTGGALDTGRSEPGFTLAAPFNFLGFFISPGKGLIFYSPLVVLGILGLWPLWREQPRIAKSIVGAVVGGTLVVATLPFWSDESWGPRYMVWTGLAAALAYSLVGHVRSETPGCWARSLRWRLRSSSSPWSRLPQTLVVATRDLTGQPIFHRTPAKPLVTPFGRDPIRWIPELSPLLFQAKLVLSKVSTTVGGPPITTVYAPYEGPVNKVKLDAAKRAEYGFGGPDFSWHQGGTGIFGAVALLLAAGAGAAALLLRVARATGSPEAERAPAP